MTQLLIIISAILIIAILFYLFRITSLVQVVKGTEKQLVTKSNKVNAALLLAFLIVSAVLLVWYSVSRFDIYNLPVASEHGTDVDWLFWITMVVTGIVFVVTQVLLFYFSFRYQHRDNQKATFYPDNNKLELAWTVVPAIALTILVITGLIEWNKITAAPPDDSEVIEIMGYQFAWKARYPGKDGQLGDYDYRLIDFQNEFGMDFASNRKAHDDFIPRELHIPKGKPVLLKIRARDVLHSVYLPHFRVKMDAVPGMPTQFWFKATKTTEEMREETGNPDFNYELACAELCGRGHFSMRMIVVVEEQEAYEQWKTDQEPWLKRNPDYLSKIPEDMREVAMIKAGIKE